MTATPATTVMNDTDTSVIVQQQQQQQHHHQQQQQQQQQQQRRRDQWIGIGNTNNYNDSNNINSNYTLSFNNNCLIFLIIVIFGVIIGLLTPYNSISLLYPYCIVSNCIGYITFICWSISFYPQIIQNYYQKNTIGLSIDFVCLNIIGFIFYTIYTTTLYYNTTIQYQYHTKYGFNTLISIQSNDVAFAIHALCISIITLLQILYYDSYIAIQQRLSYPIRYIIILLLSIAVLCPIIVILLQQKTGSSTSTSFIRTVLPFMEKITVSWLDYIYLLSYLKIFISLIKYIPQVILNKQRQSTIGWSIEQIVLDCIGGLLNNIQLLCDGYYSISSTSSSSVITTIRSNLPKFCLGLVSILFDLIFIFQHYILYYPTTTTDTNNNVTTTGTIVSTGTSSNSTITDTIMTPLLLSTTIDVDTSDSNHTSNKNTTHNSNNYTSVESQQEQQNEISAATTTTTTLSSSSLLSVSSDPEVVFV